MTQEFIRKPPDLAADGGSVDYMEILKKTHREEVLEVLAEGFCQRCRYLLETRLHNFVEESSRKMALSNGGTKVRKEVHPANDDTEPLFHKPRSPPESSISNQMHEDLHLDRQKRQSTSSLLASVNSDRNSVLRSGSDILLNDGLSDEPSAAYYDDLSEEQKEQIRFSKVGRKKDFVCVERVDGRSVNILQGLVLHTKVFNAEEQKKIIDCVYKLQEKGKKRLLLESSSKMALSNGGTKVRKEVHPANDDTEPLFHKPRSPPESSISNQMHEDLHLDRQKRQSTSSLLASVNSDRNSVLRSGSDILLNDGLSDEPSAAYYDDLSEEQKEQIRFSKVGRKKDFVCVESVNGRSVNILQGLELHTKVFNAEEQKKIVDCVYKLQEKGKKRLLLERTFSEPRKWMRGKGHVTLQFGCCYNYAVDRNGNPPGIIRDEEVDPLPLIFRKMIKRMVRWHVLPPSCVPNSCIVNIYDEGDCIPPHIDHHDFVRPFCTVSFLTECNIAFGSNLKIVGPGEFSGPVSLPLPVGSVLILNGNGADVAKHCVPGVPTKRISITFRKMDDSKLPYRFLPDPDLLGIKPLIPSPSTMSSYHQSQPRKPLEFPPLGSRSSLKHHRTTRDAGSKH